MKKQLLKICYLAGILVSLLLPATAYASGSASLSMSPNNGNYTVGSIFAVTMYENSAIDTVNVIEADISFNQAVLQLTGISCNSSAFEISAPGSGAGITCGTITPKSGNQAVATANFKVIGNGSGAINFASSSHIYRSTDNTDVWNGAITGATFTIVIPSTPTPTPAPTAPTPTPNNSNNSRRRNVTTVPTVTPTTTPTPEPTNAPTPTPTKKSTNDRHNKRWHFWGFTSDSGAGPFIGIGLVVVALCGSVYMITRRRELLKRWLSKLQTVRKPLDRWLNKFQPIVGTLKLKTVPVRTNAKSRADTFFAKARTVTKKINRISRR